MDRTPGGGGTAKAGAAARGVGGWGPRGLLAWLPAVQRRCRASATPPCHRPLFFLAATVQIYDQAVKKVPERERLGLYDIYIARASEFFGIGKVGSGSLCPARPEARTPAQQRCWCPSELVSTI